MAAVLIFLTQVVIAILVSGLVLPGILFLVPGSRTLGPAVLAIVAGTIFLLLRLAWPRKARP